MSTPTITPEIAAALETIRTADAKPAQIGYMAGLLTEHVKACCMDPLARDKRGEMVVPSEILGTVDTHAARSKLWSACHLAINGHDGAALIALRDFIALQDVAYMRRFA